MKFRSVTWLHVCKGGILTRLNEDDFTKCPICGAKSNA